MKKAKTALILCALIYTAFAIQGNQINLGDFVKTVSTEAYELCDWKFEQLLMPFMFEDHAGRLLIREPQNRTIKYLLLDFLSMILPLNQTMFCDHSKMLYCNPLLKTCDCFPTNIMRWNPRERVCEAKNAESLSHQVIEFMQMDWESVKNRSILERKDECPVHYQRNYNLLLVMNNEPKPNLGTYNISRVNALTSLKRALQILHPFNHNVKYCNPESGLSCNRITRRCECHFDKLYSFVYDRRTDSCRVEKFHACYRKDDTRLTLYGKTNRYCARNTKCRTAVQVDDFFDYIDVPCHYGKRCICGARQIYADSFAALLLAVIVFIATREEMMTGVFEAIENFGPN